MRPSAVTLDACLAKKPQTTEKIQHYDDSPVAACQVPGTCMHGFRYSDMEKTVFKTWSGNFGL
jgi:hypothetical protein